MPRVSQVSQYGRPEYSAVRRLLFGANLTDVGILRYFCFLFPDGKNILALGGCVFCRAGATHSGLGGGAACPEKGPLAEGALF